MTEPRTIAEHRVGMSEREYAAHAGISRGAVQKARATGRLVLYGDGSIDAAGSDALRVQATNPAMRRGRRDPSMRPVPDAAVDAVSTTLREEGQPVSPTAGGMTYLQARAANEVLKAQERRVRLEKLRGNLIDLDTVKMRVFQLARDERDSWLAWPARVAAIIAAELGVDHAKMQQLLTKHVREHLESLADVRY